MQGSKVRKHVVLAHKWLYDFTTRPDMRITAERMLRDIRIAGRIARVHSTEQSSASVCIGKYVNHACMDEHIFENLYGEQPCMSKNSALQRRFCE